LDYVYDRIECHSMLTTHWAWRQWIFYSCRLLSWCFVTFTLFMEAGKDRFLCSGESIKLTHCFVCWS